LNSAETAVLVALVANPHSEESLCYENKNSEGSAPEGNP